MLLVIGARPWLMCPPCPAGAGVQDLQKLARETSGVAERRLQEQLAAAQEHLFAEKQRRADAEGEAQVCFSTCNGAGQL